MNRLSPTHREPCPRCGGSGFVRWFDSDLGFVDDPCPACSNWLPPPPPPPAAPAAAADRFVVRLVVAGSRYETQWHGASPEAAVAVALRNARFFAGRPCFGRPVSAVDVVRKYLDGSPDRVVATFQVAATAAAA